MVLKEKTNILDLRDILKSESTSDAEKRYLHRLHCVWVVEKGCSCQQIAGWFDEHIRTVQRWVKHAQEYGIEGLKDEKKMGRPTKIRDDQRKMLIQEISKSPEDLGYYQVAWNGKLLQMHLHRRYGVELGLRQCQRFLCEFKKCNSGLCKAH